MTKRKTNRKAVETTPKKDQKEIDKIQMDISEQLHYLLNEGMTYEEIVMFLEAEKLHWIALHTYDTLVSVERIKPLEE